MSQCLSMEKKMTLNRKIKLAFGVLGLAIMACNFQGAPVTSTPSQEVVTPSLPASDATLKITGTVWHDLCAVPVASLPDPLPIGCNLNGLGGARANGIWELGEPGIPDITVTLYANDCSGAPINSTTTDASGAYFFGGLSAIKYCVTVDSAISPNDKILIPGERTYPASAASLAVFTEDLLNGINISPINFGWDYQYLPEYIASPGFTTPIPVVVPGATVFNVDIDANCRTGPSTAFPIVTSYTVGSALPLAGRNSDSTWWYIPIGGSQYCWIAGSTGHTSGNTSGVPIVASPSTPAPASGGDTTPPTIGEVTTLEADVYYGNPGACGSAGALTIEAYINDASGVASTYVKYRYISSGWTGNLHTVNFSYQAGTGLNGFTIPAGEAVFELGTDDGYIQYFVYATDLVGNTAVYPAGAGAPVAIPIYYCP